MPAQLAGKLRIRSGHPGFLVSDLAANRVSSVRIPSSVQV
jgi:hypothetical protein